MKMPLKYNNEILGYLSDYKLDELGNIEMLKFFLYDNSFYDRIFYEELLDNIRKSSALTLDKNPDLEVLDNNTLYQIDMIENKHKEKFLLMRLM